MTRSRGWTTVAIVALAFTIAIAAPGAVRAQSCGLVAGTGLAASAGVASYEFLDGVSGTAYGLDGSLALTAASVAAAYRMVELEGRRPHIGRVAAALPLPVPVHLGPIRVCGTGHAGAARLPVGDEGTTVVAGGLGLRVAGTIPVGRGTAVPFGEVRGLAARSTGTLLGVDVGESGLSVGVEGGVQGAVGRVTLRLSASIDGFSEALGVTPYPRTSIEAGVGVRF